MRRNSAQSGPRGITPAAAWRANTSFCDSRIESLRSTESVESQQQPHCVRVEKFVGALHRLGIGLSMESLMDVAQYFAHDEDRMLVDLVAVQRSMQQLRQQTSTRAMQRQMQRHNKRRAKPIQPARWRPTYKIDAVEALQAQQGWALSP